MKAQDLANKLSVEESEQLILTARAAAVAMAEYWDALRAIEIAHKVELEGMTDVISSLAGNCSFPPTFSDLRHVTIAEILEMMTA